MGPLSRPIPLQGWVHEKSHLLKTRVNLRARMGLLSQATPNIRPGWCCGSTLKSYILPTGCVSLCRVKALGRGGQYRNKGPSEAIVKCRPNFSNALARRALPHVKITLWRREIFRNKIAGWESNVFPLLWWKILLYNITSKYTKKISFWVGRSLRVLKRRRRGRWRSLERPVYTWEFRLLRP